MKTARRSTNRLFVAAFVILVISFSNDRLHADDDDGDVKRLQGKWLTASSMMNGREVKNGPAGVIFDGNKMYFLNKDGKPGRGTKFSIDETKSPKVLTYSVWKPRLPQSEDELPDHWPCAYSLDADTLRIGTKVEVVDPKNLRIRLVIPTTLTPEKGDGMQLWILKREKAIDHQPVDEVR